VALRTSPLRSLLDQELAMVRVVGNYRWFDGARFDHQTYRDSHMPLTARLLEPLGLRRLESDQALLGSQPAPGQIIASSVAYFDTAQQAQAALASAGKALLADVASYSNIMPELHISAVSSHLSAER
jgi:uncharacterized protein (TIGR02118 family)